jgi:hypothetical protein
MRVAGIRKVIVLYFASSFGNNAGIVLRNPPGVYRPNGRSSMQWDTSSERITALRQSIRPVLTDVPLRQALSEDFPQDCANLPIAGGWGYTQREAIIFVRQQFPRPSAPSFVGLEYHIAQKIIYEELIIFRTKDDRFSGIDVDQKSQELIMEGDRIYDRIDLIVSCWSDAHWESLRAEWEENDFGRRPGFT